MLWFLGKHQQRSEGRAYTKYADWMHDNQRWGYEHQVNKGNRRTRHHGRYRKYADWWGDTLTQAYKPQADKGGF